MKESEIRLHQPSVLEFWAATTLFIFTIFYFIGPAMEGHLAMQEAPNKMSFDIAGVPYNYYQHYLIPLLIRYCAFFLAFLALNFRLAPRILNKQASALTIVYVLATLFLVFTINMLTDLYLKRYLFANPAAGKDAYNLLWQENFIYTLWLFLIFCVFLMVKNLGFFVLGYLGTLSTRSKYLSREYLVPAALWLAIAIYMAAMGLPELFVLWLILIPSGTLLYMHSIQVLIPRALHKKHPFRFYMLCVLGCSILAFIVLGVVFTAIFDSGDLGIAMPLFNSFVQLLVVAPVTWVLFKRQMKGNEEVYALKKKLGNSTASLDFLRSQINPHFLFNALNTIYGTAIQEKAERTSEGIEKLGDMMRFMLQENVQEQISLNRDIDYLNNYISLQKLRTDISPNITIQVDIQQEVSPYVRIAPMLLIPFIENAFKHGISLREPSYIRVSLELKDSMLQFDVYNSKHARQQNDPEQYSNGIGLNNVQQRLQLLYPGRHELVIRETVKDFFVHLTIQLDKQ